MLKRRHRSLRLLSGCRAKAMNSSLRLMASLVSQGMVVSRQGWLTRKCQPCPRTPVSYVSGPYMSIDKRNSPGRAKQEGRADSDLIVHFNATITKKTVAPTRAAASLRRAESASRYSPYGQGCGGCDGVGAGLARDVFREQTRAYEAERGRRFSRQSAPGPRRGCLRACGSGRSVRPRCGCRRRIRFRSVCRWRSPVRRGCPGPRRVDRRRGWR
ncbi:MAG: hypothetical protein GAK45_00758 [Pseudomonas citronellolis]|nr:MAG: hypothetical protein GAK45_00758 [Pseudomonas citronellolis]